MEHSFNPHPSKDKKFCQSPQDASILSLYNSVIKYITQLYQQGDILSQGWDDNSRVSM